MRVSVKYNIVGEVPNQAPIISPIDNQTNIEGDTISLQVNATDPELNNITYGASGLPSGLTINTSTGLISGTINPGTESGSPYTITVTATDDGSPSEQSSIQFSWTVGLANQAPVISPVSNQTNNEGDVVSLQIDATDPELNNITYGATDLPSGLTINTSTGLISGTIDAGTQSGSPYTVTVTATDDGSPSEQSSIQFSWTVSLANQAPILSPVGNQTNDESDVVSLQVNATDPDLNNITYSATGLPTGLTINSSTGLISGTIDAAASASSPYTATITATDDGVPSESDSEVITWTVNQVVAAEPNNKYYGAGDVLINTFSGDVPAFNSGDPNVYQGNTSLTRIELGTSCTSIGLYAFGGCTNLDGPIIIGDGNVNSITTIDSAAFYGCTSLVGPVVIGSSVTSIGGQLFGDISASHPIEELYVDVPSNIWGTQTFAAANQTLGSSPNLIIYVSPTYFGIGTNYDGAWRNNNFVNSFAQIVNWDNYPNPIPNSTPTPVDTSLYDSSNNQIPASIVNGDIPANHYSFTSNGAGTGVRVEFGTSCTSIGDYAFGGNVTLGTTGSQTNIGPNITTISSQAFYYTQGFNATASIVIPNTVTSIGSAVFGASSARVFYIDVPTTAWIGSAAFYNDGFANNRILYVSSTYLSQYSDPSWQSNQAWNFNGTSTIVNWNNYPNPIPN